MEGNRVRNVAVGLAAAAIVVGAGTANANLTATEAACRATIQKNTSKLANTVLKSIDTCVTKYELVAGTPTNCNSIAVADANGGAGKIGLAVGALPGAIAAKCIDAGLIGRGYNVCPSPLLQQQRDVVWIAF